MRLLGLVLATLGLAATAAAQEKGVLTPRTEHPLHFRLILGAKGEREIAGWLDVRTEGAKTFDAAVLDLDGDGKMETVQTFPEVPDPTGLDREVIHRSISVQHESAHWALDLSDLDAIPKPRLIGTRAMICWSVAKEDHLAWFIAGEAWLFSSRRGAAKGKPIRLGPPLEVRIEPRSQGRKTLVGVALEDVHGGLLRVLGRDGKMSKPHLRLLRDGESRLEADAEFG